MTLHKVAAAHYAEARKHKLTQHKLSPLEWGPDEKKHLVEMLFDTEADPQGKDDQEGCQLTCDLYWGSLIEAIPAMNDTTPCSCV